MELHNSHTREIVANLNQVSVSLGGFPALLDLSFQLEAGEIVHLSGPNGAGKTSLLRVIAGLIRLDFGTGCILGLDLPGSERELRSHVGLVSHESFLYEDLSVVENLTFQSKLLRVDLTRMHKAMELFEITSRIKAQRVSELSAGQKKRVTLCGLLIKNPLIWLLDEPHASLDMRSRALLNELIVQASSRGTAVVVSSHELLDSSFSNARRVILIAGKIYESGEQAS